MLDPKSDIVFKLILSRPENEALLRSMIEAVVELPSPIDAVTVLNPEVTREVALLKAIVLDVRVRLSDGTLLDIEMETHPRLGLAPRFLYYWASLYAAQLGRGEDYTKLRPAISIVWLNGAIPRLVDRFHSTFHLAEDHTRAIFSDHIEMHVLCLPRLADDALVRPELSRWARFFLAATGEARHALALEDPVMSKAVKELERISREPNTLRFIDEVERARVVHSHMMATTRDEGREEGREEGRRTAMLAVARQLLDRGTPPDEIAQLTGLDLADIPPTS